MSSLNPPTLPTSTAGPFRVLLANRGNPDYGQNSRRALLGTPADDWVAAQDLAEASAVCRRYIELHELGGGNWMGGRVVDANGLTVARVAYNGRVFAAPAAGGHLLHPAA